MGTLYDFVIIVILSSHCSAYIVSHSETDTSIASVLLKEGQSAEILCMTKGTGDFFWWKGETLYNSTLVASFTAGEVSDDSQPYSVTANGTLHIRSVTLKDEGNYFCRVSSTENECYGEVKILVQASLRHFDLAIDRCDGESSCLLYLDPSQFTSLTCTALNAPPLMALKWFNGSKEITDGIKQNEILPPNGNSREITSTIAAVYGHPASLTCQAVDPKRSNDDVRFAHAQVDMTVPVKGTLPSWIIVAATLAGCFIFFGIAFLIKATVNRKQRKKYKNLSSQRYTSLQGEKDEAISQLKAEKDEVISQLKGKLRQTEEELEKIRNDNIELQTRTAKDEAKITYAEESAKTKNKEIANTDQELTILKTKLQQRDEDIEKLQKMIANNKATLIATEELARTKDQEIANKNQELTDLKSKLLDQTQGMSTLKGDLESKAKSIAELECKLKQKEAEVKEKNNENIEMQKALLNGLANDKVKTTIAKELEQKQTNEITELKDKLRQHEEEINKERNANIKLEVAISIAEGEVTVAEELAERRNKEISELKSKLKEKESELGKISKELANLKEDLAKKERAKEQKSS